MYEVLLVYINVDTLPCIWITQISFAWQIHQFDNFLGFYQKKKCMLDAAHFQVLQQAELDL